MTAYLSAVTDFIGMHPDYAAWAVFLLAFSEAIPIIGTVVPGSTLIVAISALGIEADTTPWLLLRAATLGAIVGDGTSFWLGQRCHRQVLQRWPLDRFPKLVARSEAFFNRYGGASVFLARFTAVVRAFVPLIAGIVQMPARQFYFANILSPLACAPAQSFPALVGGPALFFPGGVSGLLVTLAGARPEHIFFLAVAAMILVVAAMRAV